MSSTNPENFPAPRRRLAETTRRVVDAVQRGELPVTPSGGRYLGLLAGGASPPFAGALYASAVGEPSEETEPSTGSSQWDILPGLVAAYAEVRAQGDRIFNGEDISSERTRGALDGLSGAQSMLGEMITSAEPTTAAGAAALIEFAVFQLVDGLPLDEELSPEGVETLQRVIALLKSA